MTEQNRTKDIAPTNQFDIDYLKRDIKGRSVRGGAITLFSQGCKFLLRTGSTVILARLLTPADFGLFAMVIVITEFALMFNNLGLSTATVQKSQISAEQVSALFWINVALGLLTAVLVYAIAPGVSWFYGEPRLTEVTRALAISFIFGGLTVQHQAMLQRHMRFFAISIVDIISMAVGISVAIIAGFLGAGYWALVLMNISMTATVAIGRWISFPWLPGRFRRGIGIKKLLFFGGNITAFNFLNYFSRNADNMLIGKFLGAVPLGFYSKAYGLLMLPIRQINQPFSAVVMPALSRLNNDPPKYASFYLRTISLITFISAPLVAFMVIMSRDLILLVLGQQWLEASDIFAILGISAFIQPLYYTQGWLHMSSGEGRRYLYWGIFASTIIVTSFVAGIPFGVVGVATSYTIATYLILVPGMWYAGKSAGIKVTAIFSAVWRNWLAALLAAALCIIILNIYTLSEQIWLKLLLYLIIMLGTYLVFIVVLHMSFKPITQITDLVKFFKKKN